MPSSKSSGGGGGIDLPTLIITAIASAAAAYTCSKIWAPGTLASAAFMPVLVALLKEALAKPTYAVTRAVPVRGVVRSAAHPEQAQAETGPARELDERVAQQGEIAGAATPRRRGWQTAIITGLLGFLLAAVIITVPEIVSGKSVFGGERDTTLFDSGKRKSSTAPTDTTTAPTSTETTTLPPGSTITVPPAETVTVPPAETTPTTPVPTTTAPPATTTVPAQPPPP